MNKINVLNSTLQPIVSLKRQYWLFTKQPRNVGLLLVFLLAGVYGLYQGFVFKKKQITTIEAFKTDKLSKLSKSVKGFDADTTKPEGKAAFEDVSDIRSSSWSINLPTHKTPISTAIFIIGQADIFPYYYTIKLESFFMQLFKQGEIANPLRSLAGHFDVSFWLIFLLPLLIIILTFNALSAELDNGNWRLINSQGISAKAWLLSKFRFVGLLLEILVSVVFVGGIAVNYFYFHQAPTVNDFLFFVGTHLYLILWLSALYFINSLGKTTSTNALYSGIFWTISCLVLPTLVTMLIEKTVKVDNTAISRMSRRPQGSKFENDSFGIATLKQLGEAHPQYKNASMNPQNPYFKYAIYTAFHELMDDSNSVAVKKYYAAIETRQQLTNASCFINPAAAVDGLFSGLAQNDAFANHQFVWQTKDLHAKYHAIFLPVLFSEGKLTKQNYLDLPKFPTQNAASFSLILFLNYVFLVLAAGLLYGFGNRKLGQLMS